MSSWDVHHTCCHRLPRGSVTPPHPPTTPRLQTKHPPGLPGNSLAGLEPVPGLRLCRAGPLFAHLYSGMIRKNSSRFLSSYAEARGSVLKTQLMCGIGACWSRTQAVHPSPQGCARPLQTCAPQSHSLNLTHPISQAVHPISCQNHPLAGKVTYFLQCHLSCAGHCPQC